MTALHDALTDYVSTLRALGTEFHWPATSLRDFVDFVEDEGGEFVTVDAALRWATRPRGIKAATRARRLGIVRGFATWLRATDTRTQIPPARLLPSGQRRPTPYIYSDQEVADLMAAAHRLRSATGLRCQTYATLIGLLIATGLRPGEARTLDDADVDLSLGVLTVRNSKFGKSRLVPVRQSTRAALIDYAHRRDRARPQRDTLAFLVSERGERLGASSSRCTFARLGQETELRPRTGPRSIGRGPRLQDARHTFATRRLTQWYREDRDVERLLPTLATYLGHARIEETYWYLQAVPELLRLATERLETADRGHGYPVGAHYARRGRGREHRSVESGAPEGAQTEQRCPPGQRASPICLSRCIAAPRAAKRRCEPTIAHRCATGCHSSGHEPDTHDRGGR